LWAPLSVIRLQHFIEYLRGPISPRNLGDSPFWPSLDTGDNAWIKIPSGKNAFRKIKAV
jgi:hypothetical protein